MQSKSQSQKRIDTTIAKLDDWDTERKIFFASMEIVRAKQELAKQEQKLIRGGVYKRNGRIKTLSQLVPYYSHEIEAIKAKIDTQKYRITQYYKVLQEARN